MVGADRASWAAEMLGSWPRRSRRLRIDTSVEGRLAVSVASGRSIRTQFDVAGLHVIDPSGESSTLGWEDRRVLPVRMDHRGEPRGWQFGPAVIGEYGPSGVAVQVSGAVMEQCVHLTVKRSRWERFLDRLSTSGDQLVGRTIPLTPALAFGFDPLGDIRVTLDVLTEVLHDHPEWRHRLDDSERMRRLANDLTTSAVSDVQPPGGVRRDTTDVLVALRQEGFVFPYRRPLSTSVLADPAEVVDKVKDRLDANPFRADRTIDRSEVERIVRGVYYGVAPWPFAALVDD